MVRNILRAFALIAVATAMAASASLDSRAAEPVRIAMIDPLSGPFANVGNTALRALQFEFDRLNKEGGVLGRPFEVVAFDSKSSAQDATLQVQAAIDQGIRFVMQSSGSNVGHAVSDAVARHNAREPDKPVLYLNYGALDPALTEEKCHFWHFRFVAHGHMIMNAMTDSLARQAQVKRVYLINQDYAWGQSVARDARSMIAVKRKDIEIVGEDLHPIGKVKDFAPYVTKIKASGADAVVTGNWGNDLSLLIKAMKDAGVRTEVYAPIAGLQGTATMMGESGADRVRAVLFWHANASESALLPRALAFRAQYNEDWSWLPTHIAPEMLARAIRKAQSVDPSKVALALEGLQYDSPIGAMWMRAEDHQLMLNLYEVIFARAGQPGVKYDAEATGFGWKTEAVLAARDNVPALTCRVKQP